MMNKSRHFNLANWEIFLIALQRVGGDQEMVDIETAYIEAHKLAPKRFSWRTQDMPEIKKLSKALHDADAKGKNYMIGIGNKRQLTGSGMQWIETHASEVNSLNDPRTSLGQARSTTGHIMFKRVLNSAEYKEWKANPKCTFEGWRLSNIFKCSPDSPAETWISRLEQTKTAANAEGRSDVGKFVDSIKESLSDE